MRKIKLWKIIISSFTIISTTTLLTSSLVSCGHKKIPPPKNTWEQFSTKASTETLMNIVDHANPAAINWKNLSNEDLSIYQKAVIKKPTITVVIMAKPLNQFASFSITAPTDYLYTVGDWKCSVPPQPTPTGQWNIFRKTALAVSAKTLLESAKKADNYKKFNWLASNWTVGDKAEFDVYGGAGGSDPYKGMAGTPIADDGNHTISAIISIKSQKGVYNSDPIKAVISFTGVSYNPKQWAFSQDEQLQSKAKYKLLFDNCINDLNKANAIAGDNQIWINFSYGNWVSNSVGGPKHTENNYVIKYLENQGYSKLLEVNLYNYTPPYPINNKCSESILQISFRQDSDPTHSFNLKLNSYFYFDNGNKNVGTAFNYNWTGSITPS